MKKGHALAVRIDQSILDRAYVFVAAYDGSSFPVYWDTIRETEFQSPGMASSGYFLLRIHGACRLPEDLSGVVSGRMC